MKNCPAGINTMPVGQLRAGAAEALGEGAALSGGAGIAAAVFALSGEGTSALPLPLPSTKKPPTPRTATAASAPMIRPVLLLAVGVPVDTVEGELVVLSGPRGAMP